MTNESNVVALPGYAVPTAMGEADPLIVSITEELLREAKTGRLVGLAVAKICMDGNETMEWDMGYTQGHGWDLCTATSMLQRQVLDRMIPDEDPKHMRQFKDTKLTNSGEE